MQRCPELINFVLTVDAEAVGTELAQHTHQCGALQLPEASSWVPWDPLLCFTPSSMGACSKASINSPPLSLRVCVCVASYWSPVCM